MSTIKSIWYSSTLYDVTKTNFSLSNEDKDNSYIYLVVAIIIQKSDSSYYYIVNPQ